MNHLQVKNVPEGLYKRLRDYARTQGCTLREATLTALEHELSRSEWRERMAQRPATKLGISAASLLEQEREQRAQEL